LRGQMRRSGRKSIHPEPPTAQSLPVERGGRHGRKQNAADYMVGRVCQVGLEA
jgi:hypothetical protein